MNITINKINNIKQFDTSAGAKSQQGFINDNKFSRNPISDCFCRNSNSINFQARSKELGDILLKLGKFLEKDETLVAKTKCKMYTAKGNAENIDVFVTHKIDRVGYGMPDQEFYRLLNSEGNELGEMKIYCKMRDNLKYGTKADEQLTNGYLYLDNIGTDGRLESGTQISKRKYSGLGITLVKMALKRSIEKGFEGRIKLEAAWGSHCYHYKNGFRVSDDQPKILDKEKIESEIEKAIEKFEISREIPDTKHIGSILMYLPKKNIQTLLNKGESIESL